MSSHLDPVHPRPVDRRDIGQLRAAVVKGDVTAAEELVRRRGYRSVHQAIGDLWPTNDLPHALVIETIAEGLEPYVRSA